MATVKGTEGLTHEQINYALGQGAKFVQFSYTISIVVMTFKNPTDIYFIQPGQSATSKSIGYTLLTLLMGWWGFPWGPIYSIGSLITNLGGGKDVTYDICALNGFQPTNVYA